MKYRSLLAATALMALATAANADYRNYGTWYGPGFLTGFNNTNTSGRVTLNWKGYSTPSNAGAFFEVRIWQIVGSSVSLVFDTRYPAYTGLTNYNVTWYVSPGLYTEVEIDAANDQWPNANPLTWEDITYAWITNQ